MRSADPISSRVSQRATSVHQAGGDQRFSHAIRAEFPLVIVLGTVAVFYLLLGAKRVEDTSHPLWLVLMLAWLFAAILWSARCVVRHADSLAIKFGEPCGTLILTGSAVAMEMMVISTAMLHGEDNPTLGRDMIFAVVMIALNGFVGLCLLLGGLRHREQRYNLQGVNAYLNVTMALTVLGLVLPDFTTSTAGATLSALQGLFLALMAIVLYAIFLIIQTTLHRQYFAEIEEKALEAAAGNPHHHLPIRSTGYHAVLLLVYLSAVILLAEKFAVPLDNSMEQFGVPDALGGAVVATLVLVPEGLGAIAASLRNQMQRAINILLGSVLATIGMTIPAVVTISLITGRPITLGVHGGNLPLLLLTLGASVVTFASGRTNVLQGCVHLLLFAVFVLLIFAP